MAMLRLHRMIGILFVLILLTCSTGLPTAKAAETWTSCVPAEIMTYSVRIHVRCAASVGGVLYFAVSTTDAQFASRILSVISSAQVAGRTLTILYDPADLSGGQIGCQTNDCRLIRAAGFGQ